jgi:primosomal protein N'
MLRCAERSPLRAVLAAIDRARADLERDVRSSIDVDPVQLL